MRMNKTTSALKDMEVNLCFGLFETYFLNT